MKRKVILLGASGSIGTQTLEIIEKYPDEFELIGISVGHNTSRLVEILMAYPTIRYAYSIESVPGLVLKYPQIRFYNGEKGLEEIASVKEADLFVNALVGFTGFIPSLRIIENGIDLALANKETLVAGGEIIKKALKDSSSRLYPIDSEHSAIWQCLHGNETKEVSRLIITASGGSFRDRTREELEGVTVEQALHHPNWSMGAKITIDSATMVNKAFEVIEAHYLFDMPYDKIAVLLHPESIVHSMVEFNDHAVLAQLGQADMRIPIQYAMRYPSHAGEVGEERLDLAKIGALHFREVDEERYPVMKVVRLLAAYGGNFGAVFNGANDAAVDLFLKQKITFLEIEKAIFGALKEMSFVSDPTVEDIIEAHAYGQRYVTEHFAK
ncbi:MAG: 1-deoxy-D-xylulose-5-phosphate reductoisomerase [Erysipelotrichaceae bacterium]|nr:1-deoxy-D-xylulose-5-phosphate reductoisomerase [Erysipelotrichaceae bacterium]